MRVGRCGGTEISAGAGGLPRWVPWLVWGGVPVALGLLAIGLGRTFSWDVRNYHYYNGFAFLEDRIGHDLAPGARQSFHNPILDVFFYLAYRHLPGPIAGFLLGFVHGLNFPLLFLVVWSVLRGPAAVGPRVLLALAITTCGVLHRTFLVQVGGAAQDNVVSLFVLAGLAVLLAPLRASPRRDPVTPAQILVAGGLLGAAVGLKPTAAIYAPGLALAVSFLPGASWKARCLRLFPLASGGLAGAAATGGFWALRMERLTGNPIFPYLNQIFRSPLVPAHSFEYRRFLSSETLLYRDSSILDLEEWALRRLGSEDFRYPLLLVLVALLGLLWLGRRRLPRATWVDSADGVFLSLFFLGSFVVWLKAFALERYLFAASLLTPLLAFFLLERVLAAPRLRGAALAALLSVLVASFDLSNQERVPWSPDPFEVDLSRIPVSGDAMVVMVDHSPTSYVIPAFPPGVRFVRPTGNLYLKPWNPLYRLIAGAVRDHPGPLFALFAGGKGETGAEALAALGLERAREPCFKLRDRRIRDRLLLCPCLRRPEADPEAADPGAIP